MLPALPFMLLTAALAEWSLTYVLEMIAPTLEGKLFWVRFQYIGISLIPVGWLLFAQSYVGREDWLSRKRVMLLMVVPAITILMAFTNQWHGLQWAKFSLNTAGPVQTFYADSYGLWWWVHLGYSYLLLGWGTMVLIGGLRSSPQVYRPKEYRWQLVVLLSGVLLPWIANVVYIFRLSPIPQIDFGPLAFTISALLFSLGVFRYHLFDLMPVARLAMIERLNAPAFVLDCKDRIVDINRAACNEFNLGKPGTVGQQVGEVFNWWDRMSKHMSGESVCSGQNSTMVEMQQDVNISVGGLKRFYSLQITPLWNRLQKMTGRMVILHDVTEAKLAEEALALAQVKTDFLAKVSHELRTPLTSILGVSEMLDYGIYGPLLPEQKDAMRLVFDSTQHMTRLVNDLLEQSRLERGMFTLDVIEVSLNDLITRLNNNYSQRAHAKGLTLVTEISPDIPEKIRSDPLRLYQILCNLVENAIKYTETGEVRLRAWTAEDFIIFEVIDSGMGIPAEMQDLVFDPFRQVHKGANGSDGFGLGLSIVKQLVGLMGGQIALVSEAGKGSTFTVMLPLEPSWQVKNDD